MKLADFAIIYKDLEHENYYHILLHHHQDHCWDIKTVDPETFKICGLILHSSDDQILIREFSCYAWWFKKNPWFEEHDFVFYNNTKNLK